jgi:hypothetical protein
LGADANPCAASCRSAIARALLHRPTAHGAGPVTFFASPKKVTKERRPREAGLRLPLRCRSSAGRARNSPDRACGAPRAQTRARHVPAAAPHRGGVLERTNGVAVRASPNATGLRPRSCRTAQDGPGPSAIDCPKHVARRAAPRSCEFRWPPDRPSSAGHPAGAASWARLSLVTFFAKTKKVTGHAALKRAVEGTRHSLAASLFRPSARGAWPESC